MGTGFRIHLALLLSLVTIGLATPSHASDGSGGAVGEKTSMRMPMRVTGFDPEVARANGYEIVVTPSGQEGSVPAGKAAEARSGDYTIAGEDTRNGPCGYSFVEIYNVGNNRAEMRTGWGLIPKPVTNHFWVMSWRDVADNNNGYRIWHGPVPSIVVWNSGLFYRTMLPGFLVEAEVDTESYVLRNDGVICTSLGPTAFESF